MDNWEKYQTAYNIADQETKDFLDSDLIWDMVQNILKKEGGVTGASREAIIAISDYVLNLIDITTLQSKLDCTDEQRELIKNAIDSHLNHPVTERDGPMLSPEESSKPLTREEVLAALAPRRTMEGDIKRVGE